MVTLLRELVQVNTSNPPGNEAQVAELLAPRLRPLGFEVEIVQTPTAGKAHLIARLRAANPTRSRSCSPATPTPSASSPSCGPSSPFGGTTSGDFLLGRGRSTSRAAGRVHGRGDAARRSGAPLKRDVILLSEADEEGGSYGTRWLAQHWDKIDAGVSLNEGGGSSRRAGDAAPEQHDDDDKNSLAVTVRTRGTSTHSSRPLPDSAIRRLVRALHRIDLYDKAPRITPTARRYFRAWANAFDVTAARAGSPTRQPFWNVPAATSSSAGRYGELLNGLARDIYVPTIAREPASAPTCCRVRRRRRQHARCSPARARGPDPRAAARDRRPARGRRADRHRRPRRSRRRSTRSTSVPSKRRRPSAPTSTAALVRQARRSGPACAVTPALFEAGTDAVPWRERGIPVYGVYPYPIAHADLLRMHGNDERVPISGLEQGSPTCSTRVLARGRRATFAERPGASRAP